MIAFNVMMLTQLCCYFTLHIGSMVVYYWCKTIFYIR